MFCEDVIQQFYDNGLLVALCIANIEKKPI